MKRTKSVKKNILTRFSSLDMTDAPGLVLHGFFRCKQRRTPCSDARCYCYCYWAVMICFRTSRNWSLATTRTSARASRATASENSRAPRPMAASGTAATGAAAATEAAAGCHRKSDGTD